MAVYGISFYGQSTYGPPVFIQLNAPLSVAPSGSGNLLAQWSNPAGSGSTDYTHVRLVRSSYGIPTGLHDGTTLFEDARASARTDYLDTGLEPGRFYYYALFVKLTATGVWTRAGGALGLVVVDHGWGARMFNLLPFFYQEQDIDYAGSAGSGPLYRFLQLLGFQFDRMQSEANTLRDTADVDRISGGLLPVLASSFGVSYEPELGQRITRLLLKNYVHLVKHKGSTIGIEGAASAYSGFGADVSIGKNLLLDYNHSDQRESIGHWVVGSGCTIAHNAAAPAGLPSSIGKCLTVTANSGSDAIVLSGLWSGKTLVPVDGNTAYSISGYSRAGSTTRNTAVAIVAYDIDGIVLATSEGTPVSTTSGAWVRPVKDNYVTPNNAAWLAVRYRVVTPTNGETFHFGCIQVEKATATTAWESARKIGVYLNPERTNHITNPSFETNTTGWAARSNCTIARVTTDARNGSASLRLTSSASGTMSAATPGGTSGFPVLPSSPYTASAFCQSELFTRNVRIYLEWYTAAGAYIMTSPGSPNMTSSTSTWLRTSVTGTSPATAAFGRLLLEVQATAGAGEEHNFDSVLVEAGEFLKDYFDASLTPAADYLWEGTAHNSKSFYYPGRDVKNARLNDVLPEYAPPGVDLQTYYGITAPASSV